MVLGPSRRGQGGNGTLFEVGQARQHILQVFVGRDPQPMAGSDDRIDDRAAPPRVGMADKQEVLLADGCGPDGILDPVVIDFHVPVLDEAGQLGPTVQGVADGLAVSGRSKGTGSGRKWSLLKGLRFLTLSSQ